jgi:transposase
MDVHTKQTVFQVVDEEGKVIDRGKVETTIPALQKVIRCHLHQGVRVALEASTPAFWIKDALVAAGAEVQVTNPYKLRLIAESRNKTDENDAAILAELLRCGGLPRAVYVPEPEIRELREQLSLRRQLIRIRTQVINGAKAALRRRGEKYSARSFHTIRSWEEENRALPVVSPLHQLWEQVEMGRLQIENSLHQMWKNNSTIQRLQTIPGVGPIVAYTIVAALADIHRFKTAEQVASYAGLVPTERSSGESVVRGGITHQGRSELCGAMVQAAWAVLRTKRSDTEKLRSRFYKIMFKRGSQVAIVALARKLLTIVYQVWKQETVFDGDRIGHQKNIRPMASGINRVTVACGANV